MTIFDDDNEINNIASSLKQQMEYRLNVSSGTNFGSKIILEHWIDALILEFAKLKYKLEGNK